MSASPTVPPTPGDRQALRGARATEPRRGRLGDEGFLNAEGSRRDEGSVAEPEGVRAGDATWRRTGRELQLLPLRGRVGDGAQHRRKELAGDDLGLTGGRARRHEVHGALVGAGAARLAGEADPEVAIRARGADAVDARVGKAAAHAADVTGAAAVAVGVSAAWRQQQRCERERG